MRLARCSNGHMFNTRKYGNVCPYCNIELKNNNNNLTEAEKEDIKRSLDVWEEEEINPVVGWLVCIEGIAMGQDYRIVSAKNFIGRSEDMHIQLIGDNSIAVKNHAVLVYDPKKRNFVLMSGDSSGLVYLNEEAVYAPQELNAYDVIEIGQSKFIFIPLCGLHFEWENKA